MARSSASPGSWAASSIASNLRGGPEGPVDGSLADVPFASLVSDVNTPLENAGEILAPGYVLDLPTQGSALRSFSLQIYPGLAEILAANPNALEGVEDEDIAFKFHIVASATSLTVSPPSGPTASPTALGAPATF